MKLYVISIPNSTGATVSLGIVATTMAAALSEARTRAGVGEGVEPLSQQMLHRVDSVVS